MRIGILGGTFDPPHTGHLELARAAIAKLELDEVIFLPASRNPLKRATGQTPAKHRLAMVRLMTKGEEKMSVSDIEISRGGASYMVETLMELQMVKPGDYWVIVGADVLRTFSEWKGPEKVLRLARLGVAIRPPMTETDIRARLTEEMKERVDIIPMKAIDISATELRTRVATAGLVAPYIAPSVLQYIKQNQLYRP